MSVSPLSLKRSPEQEIASRFTGIDKIGEGTYGVVYKAVHIADGVRCALKLINLEKDEEGIPSTCLREISCLKDLNHPNIIKLFDVIQCEKRLFMVFEFVDRDLKALMDMLPDKCLPISYVRSFTWQLLSALCYCHIRRVVHRDLKPQNILVSNDGVVKIADFGLARNFSFPSRAYTHEVVTLWYRPPEVLLGCTRYSTSLDMWSIGCIFAEMASGNALFTGDSEISQLFKIYQVLGTPNNENWPGVEKMQYYKAAFPKWRPNDLKFYEISELNEDGVRLLKSLVKYPPERRLTAKAALCNRFFLDMEVTRTKFPVIELLNRGRNESRRRNIMTSSGSSGRIPLNQTVEDSIMDDQFGF